VSSTADRRRSRALPPPLLTIVKRVLHGPDAPMIRPISVFAWLRKGDAAGPRYWWCTIFYPPPYPRKAYRSVFRVAGAWQVLINFRCIAVTVAAGAGSMGVVRNVKQLPSLEARSPCCLILAAAGKPESLRCDGRCALFQLLSPIAPGRARQSGGPSACLLEYHVHHAKANARGNRKYNAR